LGVWWLDGGKGRRKQAPEAPFSTANSKARIGIYFCFRTRHSSLTAKYSAVLQRLQLLQLSAAIGKKCQHHLAREPIAIQYPSEPPESGPASFPIHTVQCATPYAYSLQYRPRYLLALLLLARQANLRSASNTSFNGRESYLYGARSSVQYTRSQRHIVTSRYNMRGMNSRDTRM
jgi:hypothetical protein